MEHSQLLHWRRRQITVNKSFKNVSQTQRDIKNGRRVGLDKKLVKRVCWRMKDIYPGNGTYMANFVINWGKGIKQLYTCTQCNYVSLVIEKVRVHLLTKSNMHTFVHFQWKILAQSAMEVYFHLPTHSRVSQGTRQDKKTQEETKREEGQQLFLLSSNQPSDEMEIQLKNLWNKNSVCHQMRRILKEDEHVSQVNF